MENYSSSAKILHEGSHGVEVYFQVLVYGINYFSTIQEVIDLDMATLYSTAQLYLSYSTDYLETFV